MGEVPKLIAHLPKTGTITNFRNLFSLLLPTKFEIEPEKEP